MSKRTLLLLFAGLICLGLTYLSFKADRSEPDEEPEAIDEQPEIIDEQPGEQPINKTLTNEPIQQKENNTGTE